MTRLGAFLIRHRTLILRLHPVFHHDAYSACLICRAVWASLMADPAFVAGLNEGLADLEAGRFARFEHR